MSDQETTPATPSLLEVMQQMLTNMSTTLTNNMNNNNQVINNNINDINNNMTININSLRSEINDNNRAIENMQAVHDVSRMELLERIDQRSRMSSRASTRAPTRAASPTQTLQQVAARLQARTDEPPVLQTPRIDNPTPVQLDNISLTQVFRDKEAADDFAAENDLRRQRMPKVSNRDNTHAYRDSYNATHRPNDPIKTESFTRTTPECSAKLDGPLSLEKCLDFQRIILDFQNKHNVMVRHTSYLSEELKCEMKARFDLTDSKFYTLSTPDLERYLSEMIAPISKAEFLSMLKTTVHFVLPTGYTPTEQTLTTFLYQLLVYKNRMFRAIEFILLHAPSDLCLPACDSKPQGLLRLISDTVPHRYIALLLESDPPQTKYENIYKFFVRVAAHSKRHEQLHKEAKFFRGSFGGSHFEKQQREALALSTTTNNSSTRSDKNIPTTTTEATTVKPPVPFSKWTPRAKALPAVVAVMKSVEEDLAEDDDEDDENDENINPNYNSNDTDVPICAAIPSTASDRLTRPCYKMVAKNYCGVPSCEYSHDAALVAAARDQQIAELTNTKREMQANHQGVMKTFEKQGSKVFKPAGPLIERKPNNPDGAPRISLLIHSPGPQLDQHVGREHECFQRIALLNKRIPANMLSHGCQTEVVLLCKSSDLLVKAMLDTGCSPGNYMSEAFYTANINALEEFLVPCPAEKVDLATSNSSQHITKHLVIEVRHIDSRGVTRTIKLRFGVLQGLRFSIVIGLYAIAMNFMEVIQDLLLIQLEHQEAKTNGLALLYGSPPQILMISGHDDADDTDVSITSTTSEDSRMLTPPTSVLPIASRTRSRRSTTNDEQLRLLRPTIVNTEHESDNDNGEPNPPPDLACEGHTDWTHTRLHDEYERQRSRLRQQVRSTTGPPPNDQPVANAVMRVPDEYPADPNNPSFTYVIDTSLTPRPVPVTAIRATRATPPFVRIVGDYHMVSHNSDDNIHHHPVPATIPVPPIPTDLERLRIANQACVDEHQASTTSRRE